MPRIGWYVLGPVLVRWGAAMVVERVAVCDPNCSLPMNLRERTLGIGMRRRFPAHGDQLNLPKGSVDPAPVSDKDIATLPSPARRYLRFMGVVGRPRDCSFRARFVGEFRQRTGQKFMPCEAGQYNTSLGPARVYYMRIDSRHATMVAPKVIQKIWPAKTILSMTYFSLRRCRLHFRGLQEPLALAKGRTALFAGL